MALTSSVPSPSGSANESLAAPPGLTAWRARRPPPLVSVRRGGPPAGVGLETREDLSQAFELDGLRQKVDRAELHALARLALRRHARDRHDRDARLARGLELQEVEPADAGEVDVEQDSVGELQAHARERILGAVSDDRFVAELVEKVPQDVAQQRIVFHDENAHSSCRPLPLDHSKRRATNPEMPNVGSEKNSAMGVPRSGPTKLERA